MTTKTTHCTSRTMVNDHARTRRSVPVLRWKERHDWDNRSKQINEHTRWSIVIEKRTNARDLTHHRCVNDIWLDLDLRKDCASLINKSRVWTGIENTHMSDITDELWRNTMEERHCLTPFAIQTIAIDYCQSNKHTINQMHDNNRQNRPIELNPNWSGWVIPRKTSLARSRRPALPYTNGSHHIIAERQRERDLVVDRHLPTCQPVHFESSHSRDEPWASVPRLFSRERNHLVELRLWSHRDKQTNSVREIQSSFDRRDWVFVRADHCDWIQSSDLHSWSPIFPFVRRVIQQISHHHTSSVPPRVNPSDEHVYERIQAYSRRFAWLGEAPHSTGVGHKHWTRGVESLHLGSRLYGRDQ